MEILSITPEVLFLLFAIALIAGFIDTLAGGGGLLTIPALILSGIPPLAALGTNKLQACMGSGTASFMMVKKKKVNLRDTTPLLIAAFIGSVIGTTAVQFVDSEMLTLVIPIVLFGIAIYFIFAPKPHADKNQPTMSTRKYRNLVIPSIGFYDGMFGPGTGSFFAMAGVSCKGYDIISSTAIAKSLNFATNIASLIVFLMAGQIVWLAGLLMMLGQAIGAWIGSHFLFKINPKHLRWLVVTMCVGMLVKYFYATN